MKILLILSLILNVVLGVLYFQEKNKPPLERFIMESKKSTRPSNLEQFENKLGQSQNFAPQSKKNRTKNSAKNKDELNVDPVMATDMSGMDQAVQDMEQIKQDFFQSVGIPEETIKEIDQIREDYLKRTSEYWRKHRSTLSMSFKDRHKMIDLDEDYYHKLEKAYGKNWTKYKKFVDDYNKKVLDSPELGAVGGPLMIY